MPIPSEKPKIKPVFKLWFEINGEYIFGEGAYKLLREIEREGSLTAAAKALGMSYRYAWGLVKNVEEHLERPIVKAQRGGRHGGKTEITKIGFWLVASYKKLKKSMTDICKPE